jgi:hypothetical protein
MKNTWLSIFLLALIGWQFNVAISDANVRSAPSSVAAFVSGTIDGTTIGGTTPAAGTFLGNTTGNPAAAGIIGEEREFSVASTGAVVTVSSATPVTIVSTGAVVTAGDYDVTGNVCFTSGAATSFTVFKQGISKTTNAFLGLGTYSAVTTAAEVPGTITAGTTANENCQIVPSTQVLLNATGTVYLVAAPTFSVSGTITAYGQIKLRRMR